MLNSDILFLFYVSIPNLAIIDAYTDGNLCYVGEGISTSIFIWLGADDFIIGTYCLFVFIFPLRKFIKMERQISNTETSSSQQGVKDVIIERTALETVVKKIVLYSSIAIISTIILIPVSVAFKKGAC